MNNLKYIDKKGRDYYFEWINSHNYLDILITQADINYIRHEPISKNLGLYNSKDYKNSIRQDIVSSLDKNLVLIVKHEEEIVGCNVNNDYYEDILVSPAHSSNCFDSKEMEIFLAFFDTLENPFIEEISPIKKLDIFYPNIVYVVENYRGNGLYLKIAEEFTRKALELKYRYIMSLLTSQQVQNSVIKKLGYEYKNEIHYRDFEYKGTKPFATAMDMFSYQKKGRHILKDLNAVDRSLKFNEVKEIYWTNTNDLKKEIKYDVPFILKGLTDDWKAKCWNFDYFAENYGNVLVDIQIKEELTFKDEPVKITSKRCTLKSYLKDVTNGSLNPGYLAQSKIEDIHPNIIKDFNFPKIYSHPALSITNLWLGPKGTKSKLHYDSDYNLFVQLEGIKMITLIPPKDSSYCYPINRTWYDTYSPIDIEDIDFVLYPLFKKARLYRTYIQPGEALFIPKKWWHDIRSISNSISLNLWWITWGMFFKECGHEFWYYFNNQNRIEAKNSYFQRMKSHFINKN